MWVLCVCNFQSVSLDSTWLNINCFVLYSIVLCACFVLWFHHVSCQTHECEWLRMVTGKLLCVCCVDTITHILQFAQVTCHIWKLRNSKWPIRSQQQSRDSSGCFGHIEFPRVLFVTSGSQIGVLIFFFSVYCIHTHTHTHHTCLYSFYQVWQVRNWWQNVEVWCRKTRNWASRFPKVVLLS